MKLTPGTAERYNSRNMAQSSRRTFRQTPTALTRGIPLFVILMWGAALLYPLVLGGRSLYWGDIFLYFYPQQEFVQSELRAGRLPLWNPFVLCGQPLVGNPQTWVFYPTTFLLPFMPVWLYFTSNTLIHLWLAGGGTYLFLRRLTHDRTAALLGAVTYMGSGFLMARIQFPTMVMAAAWLPWMLVLVDRMIDRPAIGYAALLALVVCLEVLAAHTQLAYLSFVTAILYALARLWQIRRHRTRARRTFTALTVSLALGIAAASVYLLPALQLFGLSTRENLTWSQANRFVLLPEHLLNFLFPTFFGHPANGDYWGAGNFWEPCVYLGAIPLVLGLYTAFRAAYRPAARFFAIAGLVSLWLAMGKYGGTYWIAFHVVPGLQSFHDPARFTFVTTFSFACLAAFGIRVLHDRGMSNRVRSAIVAVACLNLWAFSAFINPTLHPVAYQYRPRATAVVPRAGHGRVFTAFRDQVWKRYLNYDDYGPGSARYAHEVTDTLAPNVGMRFGVEEGSGYEPVPLRHVTEVDALVRSALDRQSPELPNLLRLFNAHVLLLPGETRYRHPALERLNARGVSALRLREPGPRFWLVRSTRRVDGSKRALSAIGELRFDPSLEAIVSGSPGLRESRENTSDDPTQVVDVISDEPTQASVGVDCGEAPAFLAWSHSWYPGWTAAVDRRPARIERTNHAFQGVALPAGTHDVKFSYKPSAVIAGIYLTCLTLAVIGAGMSCGFVYRRTTARMVRHRKGIEPVSGVQSIP